MWIRKRWDAPSSKALDCHLSEDFRRGHCHYLEREQCPRSHGPLALCTPLNNSQWWPRRAGPYPPGQVAFCPPCLCVSPCPGHLFPGPASGNLTSSQLVVTICFCLMPSHSSTYYFLLSFKNRFNSSSSQNTQWNGLWNQMVLDQTEAPSLISLWPWTTDFAGLILFSQWQNGMRLSNIWNTYLCGSKEKTQAHHPLVSFLLPPWGQRLCNFLRP